MSIVSHTGRSVPAAQAFWPNPDALVAPAARSGVWSRLAITWHKAINYLAPIGYENETGFHYVKMPASNTAMSLGKEAAQKS